MKHLMTTALAAIAAAFVPRQTDFAHASVGSGDSGQSFFGDIGETLKSVKAKVDGSEAARKMHLDRVTGKDTDVPEISTRDGSMVVHRDSDSHLTGQTHGMITGAMGTGDSHQMRCWNQPLEAFGPSATRIDWNQ